MRFLTKVVIPGLNNGHFAQKSDKVRKGDGIKLFYAAFNPGHEGYPALLEYGKNGLRTVSESDGISSEGDGIPSEGNRILRKRRSLWAGLLP